MIQHAPGASGSSTIMFKGLWLVSLLLFAGIGCAAPNSGRLTLNPAGTKKEYSQKFTQTYAAHNDDGSYEFLLIADDADRNRPKKPGQPLRPTTGTPLRQVVYVKIPWLPMRGNVAETIVSNATVNWYIFSDSPEQGEDLLQYSGVGYALAYPDDTTTTLSLRTASMKAVTVRGGLADPLGPFNLSGHIIALNRGQRLHDILAATQARLQPR
jgi:hypothetical protein